MNAVQQSPQRSRAPGQPDPEHSRNLGIAADLRAEVPPEQILRKWRIDGSHLDDVREKMNQGRYGGWLRH